MSMQAKNDVIFTHLRDNYPDLRFVLRKTNKYGRLEEGHWFMGSDYLCISFWDIDDNKNRTPKIYLSIRWNEKDGCQLILADKDESSYKVKDKDTQKEKEKKISSFFEAIAPALKINQLKTGVWTKNYDIKQQYTEYIDDFIKGDKVLIDTFIKINEMEEYFKPVTIEDFNKGLKKIAEIIPSLKAKTEQTSIEKKDNSLNYIVLSRLVLKNIGHFESLEVDLFSKNKRVIVLVGENGIGKSTLLQAIAFGLTGLKDETYINEANYELLNLLRIKKAEKGNTTYCEEGSIELAYNQKFKNILDFTRIQEKINANGLLEETHTEITDERSDYKNLKETDSKFGFISLVKSFSQVKSLDSQKENGKSEELDRNVPVFLDAIPLIYQLPDGSFDNFKTWILNAIDIEGGNNYSQIKPAVEVAFKVIQQITGGMFEFATLQANQKEIFVKTKDAPDGIPMKLISQGYTNVIGWVGDFIRRLYQTTPDDKKHQFERSPAICLIDEIDTYLHPKWQRTILKVLADTFENTQFIVTTHSPLVATSLPQSIATIYQVVKNEDGKIIVFEDDDFNPYGADTNRFLTLGMDMRDERPKEVQEMLSTYFNAIDKGNFDDAEKEENELKKLIDNRDPAILRGQTMIKTRKRLQNR